MPISMSSSEPCGLRRVDESAEDFARLGLTAKMAIMSMIQKHEKIDMENSDR